MAEPAPEQTPPDDTEVITLSSGTQILMPAASAEDLRERIIEVRSEIEAVIEDADIDVLAAMIADRVVAPLLTELRQLGDLYVHACRGAGERRSLRQRAEKAEAAIAQVRRLQEMTIAASCRLQAIHQAEDTLAVLGRALDGAHSPADAPMAVSAATEAHGGAGEAQEG